MICRNCKKDIIRQQKDGGFCDLCSEYKVKGKTDFEVECAESNTKENKDV